MSRTVHRFGVCTFIVFAGVLGLCHPLFAQQSSQDDAKSFVPYVGDFGECCTDPGHVANCWHEDAIADGATCNEGADCISGTCDDGFCSCGTHAECNDGGEHNAVCNFSLGICAPSYCNGYKVCSCWGGCEDKEFGVYDNPGDMCSDTAVGYPGNCCEGNYGQVDDGSGFGYCSGDPTCNEGCSNDIDCDDMNPCTIDACNSGSCTFTLLDGQAPPTATCPFNSSLSTDCAQQWCISGSCGVNYINTGSACTANAQSVPIGSHADCYEHECSVLGVCGLIVLTGDSCDDSNECSTGTCNGAAACVDGPLPDDADLIANPQCCDPIKGFSYDDGLGCTNDSCPTGTGNPAADYHDSNPPDNTILGCCITSADCDDGNSCTNTLCCNAANAADPLCGGTVDYTCKTEVKDQPGCCDDAPANLADNCDDVYACTRNLCCSPTEADASCDTITDYQCAPADAMSPLPGGCCDPAGDPDVDCDDGSTCTSQSCNATSMACEYTALPAAAGCCGPGVGEDCTDDGNACTIETCCDPTTVASAVAGDPCFGAANWSCTTTASAAAGCCDPTVPLACDDGNPCTQDTCAAYTCSNGAYAPASLPAGCCTVTGTGSAECADAGDTNNCTEDICCDAASAVNPASPCFGLSEFRCVNDTNMPLPASCCASAADCTARNDCIDWQCTSGNCVNNGILEVAGCCDEDGDVNCPQPGAARPCMDTTTCDLTGDPLTDSNYAHCEHTYKATGTTCDVATTCAYYECDDPAAENSNCLTRFIPAHGQPGAVECGTTFCGSYWCDGAGNCDPALVPINNPATNEHCTSPPDGLGTVQNGDSVSHPGDSECADGDHSVETSSRFSTCSSGADFADLLYQYTFELAPDYQLTHHVIKIDPGPAPAWDPLLYVRTACTDASSQMVCNDNCDYMGSNYTAADYGGAIQGECTGSESTVVLGPFPAEDVPEHDISSLPLPAVSNQDMDDNDVRDGFDVTTSRSMSVFVDSKATLPNTGGTFDLEIETEWHNNNDCRNIASYTASPLIDGDFQWKQRWRGEITASDYENKFSIAAPGFMGLNGVSNSNNPRQAFFKVDIPRGSGKYLAVSDWYGLNKIGEAGYNSALDTATRSATFFHAALNWLEPDPMNTNQCGTAGLDTSSTSSFYPPKLIIDATSTAKSGWIAVNNRTIGAVGAYEMSLIKAQTPFFGFVTGYSAEGASRGCGTLDEFDGEGVRLDFVPSNTATNGYLVTIKDYNDGSGGNGPDTCPGLGGGALGAGGWWEFDRADIDNWGFLVHPYCYSSSAGVFGGNDGALDFDYWNGGGPYQVWKELPFLFPLGDKFYSALYFDSTGRIEPRQTFGSCAGGTRAECNAYAECFSTSGSMICDCISDLGNLCAYDPGGVDTSATVKKFFNSYQNGGYAPVIAGAWGELADTWKRGTRGYIFAQSVVFEGTVSYVLTWLGYDTIDTSSWGDNRLPLWIPGDFQNWGSHVNYQVILRSDGRIVFYYRPNTVNPGMDEVANDHSYLMGVSGGIGRGTCSSDADCTGFGAGTECDDGVGAPGGYTPTNVCMRKIVPIIGDPVGPGLGNE